MVGFRAEDMRLVRLGSSKTLAESVGCASEGRGQRAPLATLSGRRHTNSAKKEGGECRGEDCAMRVLLFVVGV